mmetsp:Transcript_29215/g.83922  ORF Transcript_29215/g.83922 Transcript_29215/m.83922 type:complete len:244 (+) Transcript_29215:566-1297(+)
MTSIPLLSSGMGRYIGHVGCYPPERIDRVVLGAVLNNGKERRTQKGEQLRDMYWTRIGDIMQQLGYEKEDWMNKWLEAAANKKQWEWAVSQVTSSSRARLDADTWETRHAELETPRAMEVREALHSLDEDGRARCPHCGEWLYNLRVHLRGWHRGAPTRRRQKTQCSVCKKWRVDMHSHKKFCLGHEDGARDEEQAEEDAEVQPRALEAEFNEADNSPPRPKPPAPFHEPLPSQLPYQEPPAT